MRILVTAIAVPDSRAAIKIATDNKAIETRGLKFVCNPFDEFAIEQAVQLREARTDVDEIVAISLGGAEALLALRTALAMGADRAIHLQTEGFPTHDEIALASVIAQAIEKDGASFDLILCGKQSIDNDSGELGPGLAESLDLPHVGAVVALAMDEDGSLQLRRRVEGAEDEIHGTLPLLLTCEKGLVEPRFPSLPNIMKAKKKPMTTYTSSEIIALDSVATRLEIVELSPPATKAQCKFIEGDPQEMARELARLLRDEAKVI